MNGHFGWQPTIIPCLWVLDISWWWHCCRILSGVSASYNSGEDGGGRDHNVSRSHNDDGGGCCSEEGGTTKHTDGCDCDRSCEDTVEAFCWLSMCFMEPGWSLFHQILLRLKLLVYSPCVYWNQVQVIEVCSSRFCWDWSFLLTFHVFHGSFMSKFTSSDFLEILKLTWLHDVAVLSWFCLLVDFSIIYAYFVS